MSVSQSTQSTLDELVDTGKQMKFGGVFYTDEELEKKFNSQSARLTAVDNEMKSKDFVIMSNKGSDEKDTIDQMVKNGVSPENKKILEDLGCYSHVTNTSVLEDMGNYSDRLAKELEKSEENRDQSKINQLREKLKATTIELFGYTEEEIEKAKNEVEKAKKE